MGQKQDRTYGHLSFRYLYKNHDDDDIWFDGDGDGDGENVESSLLMSSTRNKYCFGCLRLN